MATKPPKPRKAKVVVPYPDMEPPPGFPPGPIKVGPFDFKIRWTGKAEAEKKKALGTCDKNEHVISIYAGLNHLQMADTFLHEILHAVHHVILGPGGDERKEEVAVEAYSIGLTMVARDNPRFFEWWLASLK